MDVTKNNVTRVVWN